MNSICSCQTSLKRIWHIFFLILSLAHSLWLQMCVCSTHKHDNKQRGQSIERQNKIIAWLHQPSVYENAFKAFCKSIKLHLMLTVVFRCCWLCSRFIQELDNLLHNVNSYFLVFLHIFSLSIVRLSVFAADSRWIKGFHFGGEGERESENEWREENIMEIE